MKTAEESHSHSFIITFNNGDEENEESLLIDNDTIENITEAIKVYCNYKDNFKKFVKDISYDDPFGSFFDGVCWSYINFKVTKARKVIL